MRQHFLHNNQDYLQIKQFIDLGNAKINKNPYSVLINNILSCFNNDDKGEFMIYLIVSNCIHY